MVGQQDVGDALDAEVAEMVEDVAVAEVDENGLDARPQDVDVAGVVEDVDRESGHSRIGV
jgi:hypothetical protein